MFSWYLDFDECQSTETHLCDHVCNNNVGSYTCSCREGYELGADGTTCTGTLLLSRVLLYFKLLLADSSGVGPGGAPPNNYFLSTPLPTVILLYTLFNFFLCFSDVDECFEGLFNCTGSEECENLAGSFRCLCPTRLNMIRVNGTCQCMYVLNLRQATGFFQLNFLCCFPI